MSPGRARLFPAPPVPVGHSSRRRRCWSHQLPSKLTVSPLQLLPAVVGEADGAFADQGQGAGRGAQCPPSELVDASLLDRGVLVLLHEALVLFRELLVFGKQRIAFAEQRRQRSSLGFRAVGRPAVRLTAKYWLETMTAALPHPDPADGAGGTDDRRPPSRPICADTRACATPPDAARPRSHAP